VKGDTYTARAGNVILALGRRGAPRQLGVKGEELPKVVYRLLEPEPFAEKHVLVVGGGNAAADCAIALAESQLCKSVSLSYRRHQLARLRGSVRDRLEELMASQHVVPYLGTEVIHVADDHVALKKGKETLNVANDHVIVQIGGTSPSELLKTIGIQLVEKRGEA
jgi:thioredoxin reductase